MSSTVYFCVHVACMIPHAISSFPVSCFVLLQTRTPGNSNFSQFPLRLELSGVDCIFPQFLVFAVSEESAVECLEGSSAMVGSFRYSSVVFGNLR